MDLIGDMLQAATTPTSFEMLPIQRNLRGSKRMPGVFMSCTVAAEPPTAAISVPSFLAIS